MVGVPIPSVQADYFEVFDLSDLDHTLRVLGLTLFGAGVVTTLLGIALGRFASARSLRPLADVSRAAGAIAGGELDTRLDADAADPDLEGLTNSFNAMVDQLQERIEREARFNSDVSHELRSPLTTLAASLEVLEADRDKLPARSQRALQLLSDDLRRFQRMVGDLLEMSRADAGSVDVFLEEVNVSELVQRSVEAGIGHMDGHRHGAPPPEVRIDPAVRDVAGGRRQAPVRAGHGQPDGERGPLRRWGDRDRGRARSGGEHGRGDGRRRRARHRPGRTGQGLRALLPRVGVGTARHRHRHRAGPGPGGRAHAGHARSASASSPPPPAARASCSPCPCSRTATRRRRSREAPCGLRRRWLAAAAVAAAGCAIPTQGAPSTIAPSKVPFGLLDPHPPTTTTTQPKPSSFVPVKVFFLNSTQPAGARGTRRGRARAAELHPHRHAGRPDERRGGQRHLHRHPERRGGALRDDRRAAS